jgi:hypothetical protein
VPEVNYSITLLPLMSQYVEFGFEGFGEVDKHTGACNYK